MPNYECYEGDKFSPWLMDDFKQIMTEVHDLSNMSPARCWTLHRLSKQQANCFPNAEFWECGVYRGGTAHLISKNLADQKFRLFDTFEGIPNAREDIDGLNNGDFKDTNLNEVKRNLSYGNLEFNKGLIPDTFEGKEDSKIAFAHVDVDTYESTLECCKFLYPRLLVGGVIVIDDYGFITCYGARKAVDEYFEDKLMVPLYIPTSQALIFKCQEEQ